LLIKWSQNLYWEEKYERLYEVLKNNKDYVISAATTDKGVDVLIGHELQTFFQDSLTLEIIVWSGDRKSLHYTRRDFILKLTGKYTKYDKSFEIYDVWCESESRNKGIGQLTMKKLFDVLSQLGCKKIEGSLSERDLSKREDMLVHFYKKLGFNIIWNRSSSTVFKGKIIKEFNLSSS